MQTLFQDLRYGLRMLAKNPGFTGVAVLTLALGLAAVNTIFAVVETVLLRPLDYPHSERILTVTQDLPAFVSGPTVVTLGEFQHWEQSGLFEHAAAIDATDAAERTAREWKGRAALRRLGDTRFLPGFWRATLPRPGVRGPRRSTPGMIMSSFLATRSG